MSLETELCTAGVDDPAGVDDTAAWDVEDGCGGVEVVVVVDGGT